MRFTRRRGQMMALAVMLSGVVAAGTACSGDSDTGDSGGKITLTVDTYGTFGYKKLYKQYESKHPNVTIKEKNIPQIGDYLPPLQQHLAAGSGAGDIVALEEGFIAKFKANPGKLVDLKKYGAASLEGNYIPWKWKGGISTEGSKLIGLGTDVGGLAMCYRRDLFKKAGLPTDREEVAKLWPTWDDFIKAGKKFQSKSGDVKFIDGATNFYNAILMQKAGETTNETYFDHSGKFVMGTNPAVKAAWNETMKMANAGLSANLEFLTDPWSAALKKDAFATVTCPAWMLGVIKSNAGPSKSGKWDVAKIPGNGGNWGGSWLAVTKQSEHPKEAAELAKFLTSPKGQIAAFKAKNNLPSSPKALADPAVQNFKNTYFNNAPVGEIFGSSAKSLKPVFLGANNQDVRTAVEAKLRAYEQGKLSAGDAWKKAISSAKKEADVG